MSNISLTKIRNSFREQTRHWSFILALLGIGCSVQAQYFPEIIERPASQAVYEGGTAVFSLSVFSELPVTYTWRRNFEWEPYYSATLWSTNCTIVISNVTPADACFFNIDVHNDYGYGPGMQIMLGVIQAGMETNGFALTLFALTNSSWTVDVTTNANTPEWFTFTNINVPRTALIKVLDMEATNRHRFYRITPTVY